MNELKVLKHVLVFCEHHLRDNRGTSGFAFLHKLGNICDCEQAQQCQKIMALQRGQ